MLPAPSPAMATMLKRSTDPLFLNVVDVAVDIGTLIWDEGGLAQVEAYVNSFPPYRPQRPDRLLTVADRLELNGAAQAAPAGLGHNYPPQTDERVALISRGRLADEEIPF